MGHYREAEGANHNGKCNLYISCTNFTNDGCLPSSQTYLSSQDVSKVNCLSGSRTSNLDTDECKDPCPECTSCKADFWPDLQCSSDEGNNLIGDPFELVSDRRKCQQLCLDEQECHYFSFMLNWSVGTCRL